MAIQTSACAETNQGTPPTPTSPSKSLQSDKSDRVETLDTLTWENVSENYTFSARDTAEGVVFRGKLWLSNGYYYQKVLTRDLWNSSDGLTWTKVLDDTPYDSYSELVVYQGKIWAVKNTVWNSEDGVNWKWISVKTPFGKRPYGAVVVFKDEMWQLGSGADVWRSKDGIIWECVTRQAPFGKRFASAVAAYKGKLWLCGGAEEVYSDPPEQHYPQFTTHNDVWCSEDGVTWTCITEHAPWAPRMWFPIQEYAGKLWLLGGFSNQQGINFAECWTTIDGINWEKVIFDQIWPPRHEPTLYVFNDSLWVVAGNSGMLMNDGWRLNLPKPVSDK